MLALEAMDYTAGGRRILSDIWLQVDEGEILAVIGMSGCGKTSLLKCIAGLVRPSAGSVRLEGRDIVPLGEADLNAVRRRIGLVFQYAALFDSLNVYENVAFGPKQHTRLRRADLDQLVSRRLGEVGMSGSERLMPSELSGGMRKRVGLARAMATEPAVLLYDEPTSGLDPVIARTIDHLIVETRNRTRTTSVVVSHDVRSVFRTADRIAFMHEGRIEAVGSPEDIRASSSKVVQEFLEADSGP